MKKMKYIYAGLIAASLMTAPSLTSCSDYLDVNNNPNYPTSAALAQLLPSVCTYTMSQLAYNGVLIGNMWMQYTTQGNTTNQYNTTANYNVTVSSYNNFWTYGYSNTLEDIKIMLTQAEEQGAWNYWLIATVLKAYNYHILADFYEDLPYTEALNAVEFPNPKYDSGQTVVYPAILEMLDAAIAKQADAKAYSCPKITNQDYYFNGNVDKWVAFAKSLKLKVLMRDFEGNKSAIQSLLAGGGLLEEDCKMDCFEDATDKGNPFYEYNIRQLNTKENVRACHTFVEFLLTYNDPRIQNLYELTTNAAERAGVGEVLTDAEKYEGLPCGTKPETSTIALAESSRYKQAYDDPVYLMNESEAKLLIAEAYARLGDLAKATEYYNKGVVAGFNRWTTTAGQGDAFVAEGGAYEMDATSVETALKCILTQKWASYAGANSWDGVFDRNRTGIPAIDPVNTVRISDKAGERELTPGYVLGTLVAPGSTELEANQFPRRLPYPTISTQYNPNAPAPKALDEPMWWQVAKGK